MYIDEIQLHVFRIMIIRFHHADMIFYANLIFKVYAKSQGFVEGLSTERYSDD